MSQNNKRSLAGPDTAQGDTSANMINNASSTASVTTASSANNAATSNSMGGSAALDALFARNPTTPASQMTLVYATGTVRPFTNDEHENWLLLAAQNTFEELMLAGDFGSSDDKSKRLKVRNLTERAIKHVTEQLGVSEQSVRNALSKAQVANEVPKRRNALSQQRKKETLKKREEERESKVQATGNQAATQAAPAPLKKAASSTQLTANKNAASGGALLSLPAMPYYGQGFGPLFSAATPMLSSQPSTQGAWRPLDTSASSFPLRFQPSNQYDQRSFEKIGESDTPDFGKRMLGGQRRGHKQVSAVESQGQRSKAEEPPIDPTEHATAEQVQTPLDHDNETDVHANADAEAEASGSGTGSFDVEDDQNGQVMSAETELELFGEAAVGEEEEPQDVIGPGQERLTAEEDCALSMMKLAGVLRTHEG
ncbi:hypothetical protein HII31_04182 [Pseudocercospora fuligena]|uniref:Uncharacterized protein n=1 Tax=Pseudocercospora fuligena TaxID=685502 RepID=A0A8H6RPE6_9PEZI|nr:hypothetical protein HII31_04182 [Pseudocercospora fuligena]